MKSLNLLLIALFALSASALYLPLAVKETGGAARLQSPTQTGIPLPKGKFQPSDLSKFSIVDSATLAPVPAAFSVTSTWDDGSIKFLNTQFSVTVAAGQTTRFYLSDNGANATGPGEMTVTQSAGLITIVTGPLKFSIKAANFNVIDEAYVDLTGQKNFDTAHRIIAPGNTGFLKAGSFTTASSTATLSIASQTAQRTIIKAQVTVGEHAFSLYYTAYRNKPYIQIIHNWYFTNDVASSTFSLNDLSIHLKTEVMGARHVVASHQTGDSLAFDILSTENAELSYTSNDAYTILGGTVSKGSGKGMTTAGIFEEKRIGWLQASASGKGIGAGIRYMWQMAPKMIELQSTGELVVGLYRSKSPALTYYGGNGRTHTVCLSFGGNLADTKEAFNTVTQPLYAVAPAVWYCGMTKSFGPNVVHGDATLFSANAGTVAQMSAFFTKYRLLYQQFGHAYRKAPPLSTNITNLYAFERFGNCTEQTTSCSGQQTYSGNYYDFPHLAVLSFILSGTVENLELAWIHDIDMMDLHLDNNNGDTKGCPEVDIWDNYQSCSPDWYNNANHWKAQSFFELWYITGEPIMKDFGIRACNRPMTFDFMGGEYRSSGHILEGLSAAYEATWDAKYRDRMRVYFRPIIDSRTTTPTNNYFQNGIVGEGLMYQQFADPAYTHIGEQLKAWGDFEYTNQAEYVWGGYIFQCCWLLCGLSTLRDLYPANNNYKVLGDSIWHYFRDYAQVSTQRAKTYNEQYRGPVHYLKFLLADPNYLSKYPDYQNRSALERIPSALAQTADLTVSPNPFSGETAIRFNLAQREKAALEIFDTNGKRVVTLAAGIYDGGFHTVLWDGSRLGAGFYFARLTSGGKIASRRILNLR